MHQMSSRIDRIPSKSVRRLDSKSHFPLRVFERKLLCGFVDVCCLLIGVGAAVLVSGELNPAFYNHVHLLSQNWFALKAGGSPLIWSLLLLVIWFPFAAAFSVYEPAAANHPRTGAVQVSKAGLATLALYVLIPYATPFLETRMVLFSVVFLPVALMATARISIAGVLDHPKFRQRTLIIGAGWAGETILQTIAAAGQATYQIVGFVDDDPEKSDRVLSVSRPAKQARIDGDEAPLSPVQVLGNRDNIRELAREQEISTIILAITHKVDAALMQILMGCLEHGVEIISMPVVYEQLTGRVPVEHVGDNWYVSMPVTRPPTAQLYRVGKRTLDIGLSLLGMVLLAPFLPLIFFAIRLDSPGPVFYSQERLGRNGRRFRLWKFRSMVSDAEKNGAQWAADKDERITGIGKLLRKTHIDEFPQFWNVFKGEMSAVGPRPERPEFVEKLQEKIPFYRSRLMVKPGMAGWGLVRQGYSGTEEDALVKLQYDLYYIKHQSIFLDVVILLRTVLNSLRLRGR